MKYFVSKLEIVNDKISLKFLCHDDFGEYFSSNIDEISYYDSEDEAKLAIKCWGNNGLTIHKRYSIV